MGQEKRSLGVSGVQWANRHSRHYAVGRGRQLQSGGHGSMGLSLKPRRIFLHITPRGCSPLKLPQLSRFSLGTLLSWAQISSEGKTTVQGFDFAVWAPPTFISVTADPCPGVLGFPSDLFSCYWVRPLGPGLRRESDPGKTKGERFWNPDNSTFIMGICRSLCNPLNPL